MNAKPREISYHEEPWKLHIVKEGGVWWYEIRTVKAHNAGGRGLGAHMGSVNQHLRNPEEVGNVMAAAPELLKAAKAALKSDIWGSVPMTAIPTAAYHALIDAVAKAEAKGEIAP